MSFSDFLVVEGLSNQISPPTGSSVLNSALANPLTSSTQCRAFNADASLSSLTKGNFFVSSSFNSGTCVNIPHTKSVSLRVWGRMVNNGGFGLCAKHNGKNTFLNGNVDGSHPYSGYEFFYNQSNGGTYWIRTGGYLYRWPEIDYQEFSGKGTNMWIGFRMDVVPVNVTKTINNIPTVTPYKDILTLYTASVSEPDNWIQIYNTEILTTDVRYVPWGSYTIPNNSNQGANVTIATSSYGFCASSDPYGSSPTYVDDFKIFVKDAF